MNLSGWINRKLAGLNDHKTIFAGLEKKKEYAILDLEDRFLRKTSGEDLYRESYDPVHRERARQEQERYAEEGSRITGKHNSPWKQGEEPYRDKGGREPEQFRKRRNSPGACISLAV